MEGDHADRLPGGAQRHDHRRAAGRRPHQRRDGAPAVHSAQQPVLEHRHERADGEPAGRHLPFRAQPLSGLAGSRLGRSPADHGHDPRHQYHRPPAGGARLQRTLTIMQNARSYVTTGTMAGSSSAATTGELIEKISVRNVSFYYGQFQALKSISVPLYDRKVTAFIGPSGCGKSTLLRILNRIYDLYPKQRASGEVLLDGQNILEPGIDLNLLRAKVGMVFQKPTPFPLTIYDNIAFGIRLYERLPRDEMDARVEQALRRAALWNEVKDKLNQSGLSLSGGQQQRLCIARAIAVNPSVLLMDEPASALDPISTSKIEELIDELKNEYCICIVTHNMQQAARASDFTAFMYMGELIEHGVTEDLFTTPKQKRTEEYITGRFG